MEFGAGACCGDVEISAQNNCGLQIKEGDIVTVSTGKCINNTEKFFWEITSVAPRMCGNLPAGTSYPAIVTEPSEPNSIVTLSVPRGILEFEQVEAQNWSQCDFEVLDRVVLSIDDCCNAFFTGCKCCEPCECEFSSLFMCIGGESVELTAMQPNTFDLSNFCEDCDSAELEIMLVGSSITEDCNTVTHTLEYRFTCDGAVEENQFVTEPLSCDEQNCENSISIGSASIGCLFGFIYTNSIDCSCLRCTEDTEGCDELPDTLHAIFEWPSSVGLAEVQKEIVSLPLVRVTDCEFECDLSSIIDPTVYSPASTTFTVQMNGSSNIVSIDGLSTNERPARCWQIGCNQDGTFVTDTRQVIDGFFFDIPGDIYAGQPTLDSGAHRGFVSTAPNASQTWVINDCFDGSQAISQRILIEAEGDSYSHPMVWGADLGDTVRCNLETNIIDGGSGVSGYHFPGQAPLPAVCELMRQEIANNSSGNWSYVSSRIELDAFCIRSPSASRVRFEYQCYFENDSGLVASGIVRTLDVAYPTPIGASNMPIIITPADWTVAFMEIGTSFGFSGQINGVIQTLTPPDFNVDISILN